MPDVSYEGLLAIGDPHLSSRVPGFRKDDYPQVILDKLGWCLDYAAENRLLPAVLGDWFHYPRDNANRLLTELLRLLDGPVLGVHGNHDCAENELGPDDSLSVIAATAHVSLLDESSSWHGRMGGRPVVVGGTPWGRFLPEAVDLDPVGGVRPLVIWLAHHDVSFPGYEEGGHFGPREIPGVSIVINGHIHRPLDDVVVGGTTWMNPGNIARVTRGDVTRTREPRALRIDVHADGWRSTAVDIPFAPFEEVFHAESMAAEVTLDPSLFVKGLAELQSLKTQSGAGLEAFLDENLGRFEDRVAREIRSLAKEVLGHGT